MVLFKFVRFWLIYCTVLAGPGASGKGESPYATLALEPKKLLYVGESWSARQRKGCEEMGWQGVNWQGHRPSDASSVDP